MSTTASTPNADQACAYCESRISDHAPICVRDCTDDCGSPTDVCNYACLSASVEGNDLTAGDACEWSPEYRRPGAIDLRQWLQRSPSGDRFVPCVRDGGDESV